MYFMTQQHKNPAPNPEQGEQRRRIKITGADVAPTEVDVLVADVVDHTGEVKPIVLDEFDFPDKTPEDKLVITEKDLESPEPTEEIPITLGMRASRVGGSTGKIALDSSEFKTADERKLGEEEMKAAKVFRGFVDENLPKEPTKYEGGGQTIAERVSTFDINSEGQFVPITKVTFVDYKDGSKDPDGPPSNYMGIEIYKDDGEKLRDVRYDELKGFIDVNPEGDATEIDPSNALELVTLLSAASDRGDLTPKEPAQA